MKKMLLAPVFAAVGTLLVFFMIFFGTFLLVGGFRSGDACIVAAIFGVFGILLAWRIANDFLPKWWDASLTTSAIAAAVAVFSASLGVQSVLGAFLLILFLLLFARLVVYDVKSWVEERTPNKRMRKWMMEDDHDVRDCRLICLVLATEFLAVAAPVYLVAAQR